MRLPAPSLVGDDDPTAIETNPASLGFARHGLVLAFDEADGPGDAVGLFGNLGLGSLSSAIAYQSLEDNGKLSFGLGLRGGKSFGLGLGLHWYNSDQNAGLNGLFAADAGLTVRPFSPVALGYVAKNLNTPPLGAAILERVHRLELAIRPIGTDRIEVAGGVGIGEDSEDVDPRFRATLGFAGFELRGDVEIDDGVVEDDVRATASLVLNLEQTGAYGGVALRRAPGADAEAVGAIFGLRVSQERYRPLPIQPRVFLEIVLDGDPEERDVVRLLAHLSWLVRDDRTAGVVLRIGELGVGWATIEELRASLLRLRAAHKPVYAHLEGASLRAYHLATAADRVLIGPAGGVRLVGLHTSLYFYKGTLDLLGVRADILKIAEYKSAPETLTETKSSGPARLVREAILDDLYPRLLASLGDARKRDAAWMSALIDQGPYTSGEAQRGGLVDEIVAPEDLHDWIERRHGAVALVPIEQLGPRRPERWASRPRIAVVVVEGDLVDGQSREVPLLDAQMAGGDTIAQAIERARESDARAIVVRVNSPGGMAGAADRIWREIFKTRGKKPIVASMGDVAASGGYYLASAADRVFASPSTITGSIGIFFGKLDISGLLAKLGITHESYSRGARASIDSELRPYSDEERAALMGKLKQFYDRFREVVAKGRGLSIDDVDRVGRGRVWTGSQARERRLVDAMGGLEEALGEAKRRAGLAPDTEVELVLLPEPPSDLARRLARAMLGGEKASPLGRGVAARLRHAIPPSLLEAHGEPLVRMDYEIVWE